MPKKRPPSCLDCLTLSLYIVDFHKIQAPPPYPPNYFTWLMQTPKMLLLSTYILYLLLFGCDKNFVKTPDKNGENFTLYTNENKIPIDY